MQYTSAILLAAAGLTTTVSAHGFITSPTARLAGTAMQAACGQQVYNNQASDNYGNIQGELQVASSQSDYNAAECDIWLCKGYKFADNAANVQSYTAGQVVPITVDIRAPHTGTANVSIVDTATNTMISSELAYWDVYASNSVTIPANNTKFDITIPTDLGDKCATAGDCVIQWWWDAASVDQTYEACVDFTVGGSSSGSSSGAASSAVVASSSAVASPSSAVISTAEASASAVASIPSSSAVISSSAAVVSSAAPVPTSSAFAVPTTLETQTRRPQSTQVFSSAVKVPSTTAAAATSTVAPAAPVESSTKAMPAGTTFNDLMRWITQYVNSLV